MSDKPKRVRGKKVGVKLMEDTYQPAARRAFDHVISLAEKRLKLRRQGMEQHIHDELDYKDVAGRISRMINVAHSKKALAEKLLKEAGEHRKKAISVAQVLQIVPIDANAYNDDCIDPNPTSQETFAKKAKKRKYYHDEDVVWTNDADRVLDAAMWLQPEHLNQLEVKHWRGHFEKEITKCLTMEACVELLDTATAKAAELTTFIQEGDSDDEDDRAARP